MAVLGTRQFYDRCSYGQYYDRYSNRCYTRSNWDWYGRWILLGVLVLAFFIIVPLFCCVSARRRRKRGLTPMYGSGWMARNTTAGGHYQNNPTAYNSHNNNYQPPPPQYPQQTGHTYNSNEGYYGNNAGVQQPNHVYNRGGVDGEYAPPPGPPPAKAG